MAHPYMPIEALSAWVSANAVQPSDLLEVKFGDGVTYVWALKALTGYMSSADRSLREIPVSFRRIADGIRRPVMGKWIPIERMPAERMPIKQMRQKWLEVRYADGRTAEIRMSDLYDDFCLPGPQPRELPVVYRVIGDIEPPPTPTTPTAPELLAKAKQHMDDRAASYDKPEGERSMAATVAAFNAITGRDLQESEGWLLMQILKDVRDRQRSKPHVDSLEDGIAYSALKAEARLKGL